MNPLQTDFNRDESPETRRLQLRCLGSSNVRLDGEAVSGFRSEKALALLIYLAVDADRSHRRDWLAGLFWPESDQVAARHSLRQALTNLRQLLDHSEPRDPFLSITRDSVQFTGRDNAWLDVDEFERLIEASGQHRHHRLETCSDCLPRLLRAIDLYRGPFLEQFFVADSDQFETWADVNRTRLHSRAMAALETVAESHELVEAFDSARDVAWRQLQLDPWNESAHLRLMRIHWKQGRTEAALEQYRIGERVLSDSLGIEPPVVMRNLRDEIRSGRSATPSAYGVPIVGLEDFPRHPGKLIGRQREAELIGKLVEDPDLRLVTLTGPGGVGKTRLAVHTALEHRYSYRDGVALIALSDISDPASVPAAIARVLRLEGPGPPAHERLKTYLTSRQMLLVLDNFEHLMPAAAFVEELLRSAQGVEFIVTSREPLRLSGEQEFEIPRLATPEFPVHGSTGDWERYPAVELFIERAAAVRYGFKLDDTNREMISEICSRLDGLPLAIELAAARIKLFSLNSMLELLDRRLKWLTSGPRDLPARHRTLRATIAWSYNLLDPEEASLFTRLAVFSGGWSMESAAAVHAEDSTISIQDLMASLLDKNLIVRTAESEGTSRFTMLDTVREFASEQLASKPERHDIFFRHADYLAILLERIESELRGPDGLRWLRHIDQELENIRAALRWSVEHNPAGVGFRLVGNLRWYWTLRSHIVEGNNWCRKMLAAGGPSQVDRARAKALWSAGVMAWLLGDDDASTLLEESSAIWGEIGDPIGLGYALHHLGLAKMHQGDANLADEYERESIRQFERVSHGPGEALSRASLGYVLSRIGDYEASYVELNKSADLARKVSDFWTLTHSLGNLAALARIREDFASGARLYAESIEQVFSTGTRHEAARLLNIVAEWMVDVGEVESAAMIFGLVQRLSDDIGARIFQHWGDPAAATSIGVEALHEHIEVGREMTPDQAIALIREVADRFHDATAPGTTVPG